MPSAPQAPPSVSTEKICKVNSRLYTKTIRFNDINYQLAQNEDKTAIFENWCDFLNYFDSSIFVQFSFINQRTSISEFKKQINIPEQDDEFNDIRSEYSEMLQNQLTKGNNGLIKRKYITFGIEADSLRMAKAKLDRIETDILNNFKTLGVKTEPLSGYERLKVLHDVFNMDSNEPFRFSFDMVARTGLSSKDFIAPTSFDFREGKCFKMGKAIGAVSFLQILAPELNDRMLADFLDMDSNITVNLHIRTIDQAKAIKSIKMKITDLDKMKIEEQKKAVRSGYDMEIIPSDLATYGGEAKRLLQDLQTRNERMFLVTILIMNTAASRQKLENAIFQTASIAQKYNCALKRLDFQQEEGLMSSLPIGLNQIEIERGLTTSSTAVFVPFTTQELFQNGEALYYGLNALSNNMIMVDRKQLKNPNGLILGTPGSGKSFSAKREMTNAFLITEDDIIVCDPEAEYYPLVQKLGGQVIRISPVSTDYINPLDINVNYSEEENPLTLKSDFILSMCELIVGGKDGLQPVEKTIIDRSVRKVYQDYLADPVPEKMPILEDLYNILRSQSEPEAQRIATALEIYVHGSLNVFNHRTNGLVRKGNVLHLESAKLADPNAGKQRNQNTRRFSVQVHVDALNKGLFLIFGERVDFLDTQLFWVLNQVPIQQWNSPLFIGKLHCKPENEDDIPYGLYGKASRVVQPTGIVEIRNVALNVRFGDAANLTLAEVRDQMIFGNQREAGVG